MLQDCFAGRSLPQLVRQHAHAKHTVLLSHFVVVAPTRITITHCQEKIKPDFYELQRAEGFGFATLQDVSAQATTPLTTATSLASLSLLWPPHAAVGQDDHVRRCTRPHARDDDACIQEVHDQVIWCCTR